MKSRLKGLVLAVSAAVLLLDQGSVRAQIAEIDSGPILVGCPDGAEAKDRRMSLDAPPSEQIKAAKEATRGIQLAMKGFTYQPVVVDPNDPVNGPKVSGTRIMAMIHNHSPYTIGSIRLLYTKLNRDESPAAYLHQAAIPSKTMYPGCSGLFVQVFPYQISQRRLRIKVDLVGISPPDQPKETEEQKRVGEEMRQAAEKLAAERERERVQKVKDDCAQAYGGPDEHEYWECLKSSGVQGP